ncbi:hypothetical protein Q7P37_008069 [Cladosporium fusiforme]
MENTDGAIEAELALEQQAIQQDRRRHNERAGQQASKVAGGGISVPDETEEHRIHEESPLLPREDDDGGRKGSWIGEDFSHLPWYNRPSIYWVLGPFFVVALAFGGSITPKINLILQLVCRQYIDERANADPGFTRLPVDFSGGDNDQCRIPEVQSRVSVFTLWINLITGLISASASPKLGALSDRYGRKKIIVVTSIGTILAEIIIIIAASRPETINVEWLLVGAALDGLTGSFIVAMAITNSYITDCTPPAARNVAFGLIHGCLFSGIAFGPILAGYLVKYTGKIVLVFYVLLGVHTSFATFVALFVPESLSKKRQLIAREKHDELRANIRQDSNWDWINQLRALNLLAPLKVLWPTGEGSSPALRRNLVFLAAVDTIVFGVAMGSMTVVIIYTNFMFGWKTFESSRFMSIVNSCRVFCLLIAMPLLTRFVRRRKNFPSQKNSGSDLFDLTIIRIAVLFDTVGYLGYTLSRSGNMMILSGCVAALGGVASPTLQSALTKHVPPEQTGQLLGASGLLHALARVVAPTIFNAIYAATVGKFTQTVFVCLTVTFGLAFVISWVVKPHGMFYVVSSTTWRKRYPFTDLAAVYLHEDDGHEPVVADGNNGTITSQ